MKALRANCSEAWQPLTPRGVAAFASASAGRLWLVQLCFALAAAASVVWFLHTAWYPPLSAAIDRLPEQGFIRTGRLYWGDESPMVLGENSFLALVVDLKHEGSARSPAHLTVEFGERDFKVFSLLGYVEGAYPREGTVAFNHGELLPWWGARAPAFLGVAAVAVTGGLMLLWTLLATLYCVPVWLVSFFFDRNLGGAGSWRLAGAALMPGALLMILSIVAYGLGSLDLVRLGIAMAAHLVVSWGYLAVAPLTLPRAVIVQEPKPNPFVPGGAAVAAGSQPAALKPPQNESTGH